MQYLNVAINIVYCLLFVSGSVLRAIWPLYYLQGIPGPHGNPGLPGLPGPKVSED